MNQSKQGITNWLLLLGVIVLSVTPLIFIKGAEFGGADGQAEQVIGEIKPGYQPWVKPFFEPPSGEIESLLFSSQAALGAGIIGYAIGLYKGRSQQQRNKE
ncbi:energy-coupling factor ABC transporter substrate-binding protein [Nostoc sp. CENA543]|uniref:energy-coupling factor ABC transporter substrate-binding protein n=1 Tax=Nostoc sp. CENA543 TaxID=1869241 RepID=UPI000CA2B641|nr:energy-coupling factor ABC transporter substrate-binding protein [Nostoc sp. CENA543]AUS99628.1 energy-coupling factor ABC transporter substrate-binding protein [Nostoc sp. CENA543]